MFGLSITTKSEKLLWISTINELRKEVANWKELYQAEHRRADAAVNAVLATKAGLTISAEKAPAQEDIEKLLEQADPFFEDDRAVKDKREKEILDRVQG
jgi:hypothetical protein